MKVKVKLNRPKMKNNKLRKTLNNYKIQIHYLVYLQRFKPFFKLPFNGLSLHEIIASGRQQNQ